MKKWVANGKARTTRTHPNTNPGLRMSKPMYKRRLTKGYLRKARGAAFGEHAKAAVYGVVLALRKGEYESFEALRRATIKELKIKGKLPVGGISRHGVVRACRILSDCGALK